MNKLSYGILDFYPSALKEGEGVGTAYEYYTKAKIFSKFYQQAGPFKSMLIAGLPEKYGFSFDFLLLAKELGIKKVFVQDERPEKIDQYQELVKDIEKEFDEFYYEATPLDKLPKSYDLIVSCEVLQRVKAQDYFLACVEASPNIILFAPNAGNASHAALSRLKTVELDDLEELTLKRDLVIIDSGYIDMPPFPPGMTRSQKSRNQAQDKPLEKIAMRGIQVWADMEFFLPTFIRRKFSHIVYITLTRR